MAELFSSQPRTLQEYTRMLPAGGVEVLPCAGEFVFVAAAIREFRLVIGGKSFKLQAGDHIRVERFRDLEMHNLSAENAMTVRLIVGFGEFDRRIIQGQISAVPGILNAAGEVIDDTRRELSLYVVPSPGTGYTETAASLIKNLADRAAYNAVNLIDPTNLSYNADFSPLIYCRSHQLSGTSYYIMTIDPFTGVITPVSKIPDFGEPQCIAFDGVYYYMGDSSNFGSGKGIWRAAKGNNLASSGSWTHIYSGDEIYDLEILSDGRIVSSGSSVRIHDASGNVLVSVSDGRNHLALVGGKIWVGKVADVNFNIRSPDDLSLIGTTSFARGNYGMCGFGYWYVELKSSGALTIRATDTTTVELEGMAVEACQAAQLMAAPSRFEAARMVNAEVDVERTDTGSVIVAGNIIRMALEWYRRRAVADDYLDHIHAVEIVSSKPVSPVSHNRRVVKSNGKTFGAAGIGDVFNAELPAVVTLTVDNGLNLE